jgi:hypothetical protein
MDNQERLSLSPARRAAHRPRPAGSVSFKVQERRRCDSAVAAIARIVPAMLSLTLQLEIAV